VPFARVQTATGTGSGGAATATFGSATAAGNVIVAEVAITYMGSVTRSEAMADTELNTWIEQVTNSLSHTLTHSTAEVWTALVPTGGTADAVTYTAPTSGAAVFLQITEYSYSGTLFAVDQTAVNTATSGTAVATGAMADTSTDLIVAVGLALTTGQTWSVGTPWNILQSEAGGSSAVAACAIDALNQSGSITPAMTAGTSTFWNICAVSFSDIVPVTFLAATEHHDTFAASAGFKDPAAIAAAPAGDALAASAGFKDPSTLAHATAGDTAAVTAKFTAPAALSHVTGGDTLAATAKFTDLFSIASITAGDALAGSAHFAAPATIAHVTAGDAFAGISKSTFAVLTAAPSGDTAAISGHLTGVTALGAAEHHDIPSIFAVVNPRLLATEHHDTLAASATAASPLGASLAHTTAGDTFGGIAGFTFDTRFALGGLEQQDRFAGIATQSSAGALGAVSSGDAFLGATHTTAHATIADTTAGDTFAGGHQGVAYAIFTNAGSGPINYASSVATTAALTWTSGPLTFPDTWMFAVRAFWVLGGLEEQNLDCEVTVILSATGQDISNVPAAPLALRAFPTIAGGIRVEWFYPPTYGAKTPIGFNVYLGTGLTPNYGVVAATVLYSSAIGSNLVANIPGLTGGDLYQVGVRAYNATGVEQNTNTVSVTPISTGPLPVQSLVGTATSFGA
jgi:hypothetical protein